ncbi:MAG: hypothetical protein HY234_03190 [Acidobacteria bacterium]|nr:hypothetical protein [Acidobacteriota bacterium]
MNGRSIRVVLILLGAMVLCAGSVSLVSGQKKAEPAKTAKSTAVPQQNDADYTADIQKYTTEKYFLTELVDHLPASATVPSPKKVLGYSVGTEGKLTYTKDIYRYYHELTKASPRVKVWTAGKSEEGREFLLVAVTDESNLAQLDKFKKITANLSDPRKLSNADAAPLIKDGKPIYWASGSIHSPETGSPEMLMELAYRLAVEESPFIQNIRKNVIFLITPVVEVDGRDRMVDIYNYRKANPDKPAPGLVYWGKYVAHDNNRDSMAQALELSKTMMKNFLDWHPQVLHDLHESVPYLYTSTGTGPYNAWLDPIVISEWQKLAYWEIEHMTQRGVPGVWTHGFYDGWAANYMFYVANGHNSIGRFYETFGNGGADTRMRTLAAGNTARTWFRPNPPLARVRWSIRNNVNMQQSALLFALQYTADHGKELLENFYLKSKRSVAKAATEGPAAWVIPNDGKRPALAAGLARLMQQQGAEVHTLTNETEIKDPTPPAPAAPAGRGPGASSAVIPSAARDLNSSQAPKPEESKPATVKIPAGSYIIRMDQPYSRMVDMLLDTQYYSTSDPRPYDDTGWTMGPLRNIKTLRVTDTEILKASMTLVAGAASATGSVSGSAIKLFVINANAEPGVATFRFRLKDVKILAAEDAFEADGQKSDPGAFLIPTEGNPADLRARIESAAKDLSLRVVATASDLKVERHAVALPRIALMHTWVNTQNEGWYRLMLEEAQVPYDYISDAVVRTTPNLKSKYDVILFPPVTSSLSTLINGVRKRLLADGSDFGGPIPWKNSDLTPNLTTADGKPDSSGDIRGGLGFEGLANLKKFIEDGGVFIPISAGAALPVELGITEGVSIATTSQLQARGSIVSATVEDKRSPIAYGYDDSVALYFNQSPVFRVSLTGGGGGFGGGGGPGDVGGARTSGRGSATDPDIPQGRPWTAPEPEPRRSRAQQEAYIDPDIREFLRGSIPPPRMWPRVVLRFAEEKNLWVSGMLADGSELAQTPAVIDAPVGRGHVVFFANNPMWRHETQGSFMLVLNAALHFDNLHVGRSQPAARPARPGGEDDFDFNLNFFFF